jgi:rubrerythrin
MFEKSIFYRMMIISMGCLIVFLLFINLLHADSNFSATIQILQTLYKDEIQAFHNYRAYARKAESENHPNIAKLFVAFATSESIHARNFKAVLSELGAEPQKQLEVKVEVSSTKKNLNRATKVELEEIDNKYPQFVETLKSENHEAAIQFTTYAWESEKQHRDLIKRIKSGTGIFFGLLKKEFNESPTYYFVCRNCGSTLTETPKDICPICGTAAAKYKKIEANN